MTFNYFANRGKTENMPTQISVRVYPKNDRTIVTSTAELHTGCENDDRDYFGVLHESHQVTRKATYTRVDGSENRHNKLRLQSLFPDESKNQSIWLKNEGKDRSLEKLFDTLVAARHVEKAGDYVVINVGDFDPDDTEWLLDTLRMDRRKLKLLPLVTDFISDETSVAQLRQLFLEHPNRAQRFYAALNYERLSQVLEEFKRRIIEGCGKCEKCVAGGRCPEKEYQRFLEEHYWILGSEYSQMLERTLTWKGTQDFNMRRTADDYLEVIEIKTPDVVLFKQERERLIEKEEVVNAINQVDDYQMRIEDNWKPLNRKYPDLRLDKLRGKVIIGRSNQFGEEEKTALRRLNARLHGIEVITFDQLIANAERMLKILGEQRTMFDGTQEDEQETAADVADEYDGFENGDDDRDCPASVDDIPF